MFVCAGINSGIVMTGLCEVTASLELVGESQLNKDSLDT